MVLGAGRIRVAAPIVLSAVAKPETIVRTPLVLSFLARKMPARQLVVIQAIRIRVTVA